MPMRYTPTRFYGDNSCDNAIRNHFEINMKLTLIKVPQKERRDTEKPTVNAFYEMKCMKY